MASDSDVVGWGRRHAPWANPDALTASRAIAMALFDAGVTDAFGVLGGGIAPFAAGLDGSPIRFRHFRHEAGAGFAALEAWFETGRPAVAVVTTGPGIFNVLNAAMAARVDGASYLVVSGFTPPQLSNRGAVQETTSATMPAELLRPGSIFHDVAIPTTVEELEAALARIARRLAGNRPYVAHLGLPLSLQSTMLVAPPRRAGRWAIEASVPSTATLDACLAALEHENAVVWLGHGARKASAELRRFCERADLPVVCSPRAKGVFAETHPLFVGVSGAGGSSRVRERFAAHPPETMLVIGSRLGEVTTFLAESHCPTRRWIQVDIDADAFGGAFPHADGIGIVADAQTFAVALDARATETGWYSRRKPGHRPVPYERELLSPRAEPMVRPAFLMQTLQQAVVRRSDALVMSEAGSSFTWCNAHLAFDEPNRYRTSAAWGSMGHFTAGAVGAALAGRRVVVAVVGDGAMLMNNEINTAVQYDARVVWVILNDAQLGLNQHGMVALGMNPVETQIPRTDFVAFARAQGADGIAVRHEAQLADAIARALAHKGPFVVDVAIDPSIVSPVIADRVRSLQSQTAVR